MTSLWKIVIWLHSSELIFGRKERREKRESFVKHREERKKGVFFDFFSFFSKHSRWNQEGAHSLKRFGDKKE